VVLVGAIVYANAFGVPFQFDDGQSIVENPGARGLAAFLGAPGPPTRVVGYFTFALNGAIHGLSVAGFHAVNLLVHVGTALLVYALVRFACLRAEPATPALRVGAGTAALVAALLFVVHPLQTQAVTYIVQRVASLAALLFVGSVLAYGASAVSGSGRRRVALYGLSVLLAVLAFFTKENTLVLPVVLLAIEWTLLPGAARARALRLAPFFGIAGWVVVTWLLPDRTGGGAYAAVASGLRETAPTPGLPLWGAYLVSQPRVILKYLALVLLPVGQTIDHDPPQPTSALEAGVLGPVVALTLAFGGAAVLAWRARERSGIARISLLALAWIPLCLGVESSVIPLPDRMFEHRMYLPMAGICMGLGVGAAWLDAHLGARRGLARGAFALLIAVLGAATIARNQVWRERRTLWEEALASSPAKSRPYVYVAQDRLERGEVWEAIALLERAARLPAPVPHVFLTLGSARRRVGDLPGAEAAFRQGLARGGALRGAHRELGLVLLDEGRVGEACEEFSAELKVAADDFGARDNFASCRFARGDVAGAAADWARLAAEGGGDPRLLFNLALSYATLGDRPRAREAFQRFLAFPDPALAPQQAEALRWLAANP
jgi:Flp pilus assembly protein TadD